MEDFARELKQGPTLFLLYGEQGVGKTRLLEELGQTRLAEQPIFWLDLGSGETGDETRMDRSAEVEALFSAANNGDLIIADHFEMALKKTRHQLFLSWSTDGIDKQLKLIIASNSAGLNELRQLAQQYQVRVESFELMPFSEDEVQAFLGFSLFPDHPVGKLAIPSSLRKQIAAAHGNVERVAEIIDRDGNQITSEPVAQTESIRQGSRVVAAVLLLFVLAVGIGWYLFDLPGTAETPTARNSQPDDVIMAEPSPVVQAETTQSSTPVEADAALEDATEPESTVVIKTAAEPEPITAVEIAPEPEPVAATETAAESVTITATETALEPVAITANQAGTDTAATEAEAADIATVNQPPVAAEVTMAPESGAVEETQQDRLLVSEPGTASDSEAVIVDEQTAAADEAEVEPAPIPANNRERFELELQQSLAWIEQRGDRVGTIQILLLSYDGFDADNYYAYVDNLARKQVDTGQIRVFKTFTSKREVYSVMYGEFASRNAAIKAIDGLPAALRDTSPLGRSVGGIRQEIRRLETKN